VILHETPLFDVASYDPRSVTFVADVCSQLVRWTSSELQWARPFRSSRVRVELVPPEVDATLPCYRINDKGGQVTLYVRWARDTSRETISLALAHAFVARIFQENGALAPAASAPRWLVEAYALELTVLFSPALADEWARHAFDSPPRPFSSFDADAPVSALSESAFSPGADSLQALWFWRHLRREFAAKKIHQSVLFLELARGQKLDAILAQRFPEVWSDAERHMLWWPTGGAQLVLERNPAMLSMKESREFFDAATRFIFAPNGEDKRFTPAELIALRRLPIVREGVRLRHLHLKRELFRANPVWHNAWRAYGVFLENFHRADEAILLKLWATARTEAVQAAALESEVARALRLTQ
jgi:hypothetical protein